jgi:hypothetical protein
MVKAPGAVSIRQKRGLRFSKWQRNGPKAKPLIDDWAAKLLEYLFGNFKNLEAGHKVHPKLVGWLCRVGGIQGVECGGKQYPALPPCNS